MNGRWRLDMEVVFRSDKISSMADSYSRMSDGLDDVVVVIAGFLFMLSIASKMGS